MRTIIGTNAASLILITISALAIQGMIALDEKVLTVLKIFGSFYLLYYANRLKEIEKQFIQSEKSVEHPITEKMMLEKQLLELQERFNRLEQQYTAAATKQHQAEIELAMLKAKHK